MAYDGTQALPQGSTKLSEIFTDRAQPVLSTVIGASAITPLEYMRRLAVDVLRKQNQLVFSRGEILWDGANLQFATNAKGTNIVYRILQTEGQTSETNAPPYIDLVLTGAATATANEHSSTLLDGITTINNLQIGMYVFGPGIQTGTFVVAVNSASSVTLNQVTTTTVTGQTLTFATPTPFSLVGNTHSSNVMDALFSTSGLAVGMPVFGSGIQLGTTIAAITGPNSIQLSQVTTSSLTTQTFTGIQIITPTGYFLTCPVNNLSLVYLEINRDYLLNNSLATGQMLIENGVNGSSTAIGRILRQVLLTTTQGMPNYSMLPPGSTTTPTFALPLASCEFYTEGLGTYQPLYWIPHGLRWESGTLGFIGEIPSNLTAQVPTGAILEFGGGTVPVGYLAGDGSVVSQTIYSQLYAQYGSTWNTGGEGVGMFRLPDTRGKVGVGVGHDTGNGLTNRVLGTYGVPSPTGGNFLGEEAHSDVLAEMPSHNHGYSDPGHGHGNSTTFQGIPGTYNNPGANFVGGATNQAATAFCDGVAIGGTNITFSAQGSGSPHNNIQPSYIATKIIKY